MAKGATKDQIARAESGDYLTLDERFCRPRRATRILGGSAQSRTDALVRAVVGDLRNGRRPDDICVVCASPSNAEAFRDALAAYASRVRAEAPGGGVDLNAAVALVDVTTAREVAMRVLADPRAQQAIGREFPREEPRVLSAFEVDFVLEDLKTMGARPKRLRELLKFIYRGWTELADESDDWLVTVEEHDVVAFLHDELSYLQGVMEPELSNLASKALRARPDVFERFSKGAVYVSEYQNLSRASQLACNILAREAVTVAARPSVAATVHESYPYAQGVEEFLQVNPGAETVDLRTVDADGTRAAGAVVETATWDTPDDEIAGIADAVAAQVAQGGRPEDIAVVCFHPRWYNRMLGALRERGVAVCGLYQPLSLKGDVRYLEAAHALRVVTVLRLLDDPTDSMSWRCWVGYGDYLAKSGTFVAMREAEQKAAREQVQDGGAKGRSVAHVHFSDAARASAAGEGIALLLESCAGKTGVDLLEHIARCVAVDGSSEADVVPAALAPLRALGSEATARDMVAELERLQFLRGFSGESGVAVVSLEAASGLSFDAVYAFGFVNGLFPRKRYFDRTQVTVNQQRRIEEVDTRRAAILPDIARGRLVLSGFERIECGAAERCGVKQDRIYVEPDGSRFARVSPSVYADRIQRAALS